MSTEYSVVPVPTAEVTAIRETNSGAWSLDISLNISSQLVKLQEVYAKRHGDRITVRLPQVMIAGEWRSIVQLPPSWFATVWGTAAIAVESAEIASGQ